MSYMPKVVRCKMNFKNITDEEIRQNCSNDKEVEGVRKFYEKLEGAELYLSLWDFDNYQSYHLRSWGKDSDDKVKAAFWEWEKAFGMYDNFNEFQDDWKEGEYDCGGSVIFPKKYAEVLEVVNEESNDIDDYEKLELLNSIEVIEVSSSCGEVEYILIDNNDVNREILNKIGVTNKDIEEEGHVEEDSDFIDISSIAGRFANYYNSKIKKFYNKKSEL